MVKNTIENPNIAYERLKDRLGVISDLTSANNLLFWDRQTYMPKEGATDRGELMATLSRLAHETLVDAETGRLLDSSVEPSSTSEKGALVRRARREYERSAKLPTRLVQEIARTTTLAESIWIRALEDSDWALFAPHLEKIVALNRESAEYWGYEDHPYDALLEGYEPGLTTVQLEAMFEELKVGVVPLVQAVAEQSRDEEDRSTPLYGTFDEALQEKFTRTVISAFGYDWARGRQDRSVHPFTQSVGTNDVRMTTRFNETWLAPALFNTMHECGHGLYEQGINPDFARTPLGNGASIGIHESQSRLWENLVGRSKPFWLHYYPRLQELFPEALSQVSLEGFYRAINVLKPSEIRVEADEVTYNLHILLRFELEVALIEGSLAVADLPAAWNAKMEEYLGLTPENDAKGVLQDIHWSNGVFGYFPTYAIGNVLSVQFFDQALKEQPVIPAQIKEGDFSTLRLWLLEHIYRHGARYYPNELVERATGRPLDTVPYVRYLKNKFGELYDL